MREGGVGMTPQKHIPPFLLITYLGMLFGVIAAVITTPGVAWLPFTAMLLFGGYCIGSKGPERDLI